MDLLERYLQAVGQYLPAASKDDTLAELRANLLAQMDALEEETGRPLSPDEMAGVLKKHGRPELVAARYLPQQSLIGPELFPSYLLTLRRALPFVVLIYSLVRLIALVVDAGDAHLGRGIVQAIVQFPPVLFAFWAWTTLAFAGFEYAMGRWGVTVPCVPWDPAKLPRLEAEPRPDKRATRVADVVAHLLGVLYVLAVPYYPYLILGPGAGYLNHSTVGLRPEWHLFYLGILLLAVGQLAVKVLALFRPMQRSLVPLVLAGKALGVGIVATMVAARDYFIPRPGSLNLHSLSSLNYAVNLAFKIALVVAVLDLGWSLWLYVRSSMRPVNLVLQ